MYCFGFKPRMPASAFFFLGWTILGHEGTCILCVKCFEKFEISPVSLFQNHGCMWAMGRGVNREFKFMVSDISASVCQMPLETYEAIATAYLGLSIAAGVGLHNVFNLQAVDHIFWFRLWCVCVCVCVVCACVRVGERVFLMLAVLIRSSNELNNTYFYCIIKYNILLHGRGGQPIFFKQSGEGK